MQSALEQAKQASNISGQMNAYSAPQRAAQAIQGNFLQHLQNPQVQGALLEIGKFLGGIGHPLSNTFDQLHGLEQTQPIGSVGGQQMAGQSAPAIQHPPVNPFTGIPQISHQQGGNY